MANRYWVDDLANGFFLSATNWSATSGGVGGAGVPGASDKAIFDGSVVDDCRLNAAINCAEIEIQSGYTGTLNGSTDNLNHVVGGPISHFAVSATLDLGSGTWVATNFDQTQGTTVESGNTITLSGYLTIGADVTLTKTAGTEWILSGTVNIVVREEITELVLATGADITCNSDLDCVNFTQDAGDFDANDKAINISGDCTLAGNQVDCGTGTWTISGNYDPSGVTTYIESTSTVVMNGASKTIKDVTGGHGNITIDGTISVAAGSDLVIVKGLTQINASKTLTIGSGLAWWIDTSSLGDLKVKSSAAITGDGQLRVTGEASISEQAGTIDVATLTIQDAHDADIVAGTYASAEVIITYPKAGAVTFKFAAGTFNFSGNVTINSPSGVFTIDAATNNPDFNISGAVLIAGGAAWTKGTGTITLTGAGTGTQAIDLFGESVNAIVVNDTGATKVFSAAGFTSTALTVSNGTVDNSVNDPDISIVGALSIAGAATWTRGTGTITLAGAATGTQSIDSGGNSLEAIVVNDAGATKQLSAVITTADLTVTAGTLDTAGFDFTVDSNIAVASGALMTLEGDETATIGGTTTLTGEVDYYGTGSYTGFVLGNSYGDLTISGTGDWTVESVTVTTTGDLSISNGGPHSFSGSIFNVGDDSHFSNTDVGSASTWYLNVYDRASGTNVTAGNCDASGGNTVGVRGLTDNGGLVNWVVTPLYPVRNGISVDNRTEVRKDYIRFYDGEAAIPTNRGILFWDDEEGCMAYRSRFTGVTLQIGQEFHQRCINKSGAEILDGTPVYVSGVDTTTGQPTIEAANAASPATSANLRGILTSTVADDAEGVITKFGHIHGFDTSGLTAGLPVYLDSTVGGLTSTRPRHPNGVYIVGGCLVSDVANGVIDVGVENLTRPATTRSYSFTSNGIGAGAYYSAGYYDFPTTDANLTQASLTQTYGTANVSYAAHASVVCAAAGTVDTGVVGLRVTGTSITDAGVRTGTDSEVLTADITAVATDEYLETNKKWIGTITFELYVVTPTPTTYSLDFNYGFTKYEDIANQDFTITACECVGLAGATDTTFNIELLHHKFTGWTYAATGFVAGNGALASWSTDMSPEDNLANGVHFAWKQTDINQFIGGNGNEGVLYRITCGNNNSVQSMDLHLAVVIE